MKARIRKWGNSLAVRIPKPIAGSVNLHDGDEVEVQADGPGTLSVIASRRKLTLADLVRQITPKNRHGETDWGPPRGGEAW